MASKRLSGETRLVKTDTEQADDGTSIFAFLCMACDAEFAYAGIDPIKPVPSFCPDCGRRGEGP
jgi:hypothetical protein